MTHCIDVSVEKSNSIHEVLQNSVLQTIWRELCKEVKAQEFVNFLYKDLLQNQFMLESLANRVVVDSDLFEEGPRVDLGYSWKERESKVK